MLQAYRPLSSSCTMLTTSTQQHGLCRRSVAVHSSVGKNASIPVRDETGRFIGVRPKTAAEAAQACLALACLL